MTYSTALTGPGRRWIYRLIMKLRLSGGVSVSVEPI
jgi:hypothetical protein